MSFIRQYTIATVIIINEELHCGLFPGDFGPQLQGDITVGNNCNFCDNYVHYWEVRYATNQRRHKSFPRSYVPRFHSEFHVYIYNDKFGEIICTVEVIYPTVRKN